MNTDTITETITDAMTATIADTFADTIGEVGSALEVVPEVVVDGFSTGLSEGRRLVGRLRWPSWARARRPNTRTWWIVGGVIAVSATAAGIVWYRSRRDSEAMTETAPVTDMDVHRSVA